MGPRTLRIETQSVPQGQEQPPSRKFEKLDGLAPSEYLAINSPEVPTVDWH